jgi:hypothetical protein
VEHFVVSEISLASAPEDAAAYEFIPTLGEGSGGKNRLGFFRSILADVTPALDEALASSLEGGGLLWLVRIERCAEAEYVRISMAVGQDTDGDPTNNFSGSALLAVETEFGIGAVDPAATQTFVAAGGDVPIPLAAFFDVDSSVPVNWLPGYAVVLEQLPSADGLEMNVGVGVPKSMRAALGEPLSRTANYIVAADEGCPEACVGNVAFALVTRYDTDHDGVLSAAEVLATTEVGIAFASDLDVTAGTVSPVFWPGADGVTDHVSIGLRVRAVPYVPSTL